MRANNKRGEYYCIRAATRGIVFLATPFRGTSFQDVAAWAETVLKAKAALQGRAVSRLLENVKGSTFELEESVRRLTQLCQDQDSPCEVFAFYETRTTSLPHKVFPYLPDWLHERKQVSVTELRGSLRTMADAPSWSTDPRRHWISFLIRYRLIDRTC